VPGTASAAWTQSFKGTLLIYLVLFAALTFPYWLKGEVIAPYRQAAEIAATSAPGAAHLENRKFSDYAMGYIPEVNGVFDRNQSAWLGTWTARNELGRPLDHTSGLSSAYPPSLLLGAISDSPYRFITLLSLATCLVSGIFILLLCRELGLAPLAGLLAGASLAASPFYMYWLTFPMFTAAYCWAAGAIYGVARIDRKPDFIGWSVLAFSLYSLLMTGYQQLVVFHAYLLAGYGGYLCYRRWQAGGSKGFLSRLAVMATAAVAGGALALPMYLDLAHIASESARVAPDPSFFMANFPKLESLRDIVTFVVLGTFPEILGNPVSPAYPLVYNGRSVTPLVIFLALVALLLRGRETWGWWLAIVILCLLLFFKPLYVLGVKYLGFNLSRSNPIGILVLPVTIISAYGADALLRRMRPREKSLQVLLAASVTALGVGLAVALGLRAGMDIRWSIVLLSVAVVAALAAQGDRTRPGLLLGALVAIGAYVLFPLMLRQDPEQIATTSPLVRVIQENVPAGSRYAVAPPGIGVLPPNLNATYGLASIHSYNSLSSRRYHTLIKSLGGEVQVYGRWNDTISPDYGGAMFWMSDIALVLSASKVEHANLEYLGTSGAVHLHRVTSRMGCCLQLSLPAGAVAPDGVRIAEPRTALPIRANRTVDQGDLAEIDVVPGGGGLLVVSHKFHRDWRAEAFTGNGWIAAQTTPVNGVFQGVLLPDGARKVKLEFRPYVRLAWIAHAFWLLVLALLAIRAMRTRYRPAASAGGRPVG